MAMTDETCSDMLRDIRRDTDALRHALAKGTGSVEGSLKWLCERIVAQELELCYIRGTLDVILEAVQGGCRCRGG